MRLAAEPSKTFPRETVLLICLSTLFLLMNFLQFIVGALRERKRERREREIKRDRER